MFEKFINEVEKVIDSKQLLTSKEALLAYSLDATRLKSMPKAVFLPETSKQLRDVIRLCNEFSISVTPRGSGTGLSGGAVPAKGSLVISFSRMNSILNIDTINLIAEVEPGVITANLQEEVSDQSLFYPPDPSSAAVSTIGGNIAEGAGGPKALKYGVTRDYVMGLEIVLPDGSLIRTGGSTYKNVSGYDLTRLMTASEGSLGLIMKA
ncbi:MAG: FAD-binding protein, partial [Actinobacteria bacterium]